MPLNPVVMVRIDVLDRRARFELAAGEVGRNHGEPFIILQPGGLLAIALSGLAVALPAFRLLPDLLAAIEELLRRSGRLADVQRSPGRLFGEKGIGLAGIGAVHRQHIFDVLDDGEAIVERQVIPRPASPCRGPRG